MITPEEIKKKAQALYRKLVIAEIDNQELFPLRVPANRRAPADHAAARKAIDLLRSRSKESTGTGYSVEWQEKNSAKHGRNAFPKSIYFESQQDYLNFIGKASEFKELSCAIHLLKQELPALNGWMRSNIAALTEASPIVDGLVEVVHYFTNHPRPNLYARQLPLSVDTKFIEQNSKILSQWLDLALPPESIKADEKAFSRRYGLKAVEPHILIRLLDDSLQTELEVPWTEFSLPASKLSKLPVTDCQIFIVENKLNIFTLEQSPRSIVLGGLGMGVSLLREISWLQSNPITYWGDLDVEGFEILSQLRVFFPNAKSFLMDAAAVEKHLHLSVEKKRRNVREPGNLTKEELEAFEICFCENLRIEQERIPCHALSGEPIHAMLSDEKSECIGVTRRSPSE